MNISKNYINVQGWMVSDLELKGNNLLIYAIIYGFCQAENCKFTGSLNYLTTWTNSTKQGIIKNLKTLQEKGLIKKEESFFNGVKNVKYYVTKFNGGVKQSLTEGIKQSLPNNIEDNNIEDNIEYKYSEICNNFIEVMEEKLNIVIKSTHKKSWSDQIRLLIDNDLKNRKNPSQDAVNCIQAISDNYGKDYFPIIQSGKSFREKFVKIENYINRNITNKNNTTKTTGIDFNKLN